jgi:dTDP-4-dehydrorhamnose 3,5-epimerase
MKVSPLSIPEVVLFEPKVFGDDRGFFYEKSYSKSQTKRGLRGLHYQLPPMAQGKLARVIEGEVLDIAVDIRKSSTTFGQWVGERLSAQNNKKMWIPEGFAHGFITLSDTAQFVYKTTNYYSPDHERCIAWDDPAFSIDWQLESIGTPSISAKDQVGALLANATLFVSRLKE